MIMTSYEVLSLVLLLVDSLALLCACWWLIHLVIKYEKAHPGNKPEAPVTERINEMLLRGYKGPLDRNPADFVKKKTPSLAKKMNNAIKKEMSRRDPDGRVRAKNAPVPVALFPGQFHLADRAKRGRRGNGLGHLGSIGLHAGKLQGLSV